MRGSLLVAFIWRSEVVPDFRFKFPQNFHPYVERHQSVAVTGCASSVFFKLANKLQLFCLFPQLEELSTSMYPLSQSDLCLPRWASPSAKSPPAWILNVAPIQPEAPPGWEPGPAQDVWSLTTCGGGGTAAAHFSEASLRRWLSERWARCLSDTFSALNSASVLPPPHKIHWATVSKSTSAFNLTLSVLGSSYDLRCVKFETPRLQSEEPQKPCLSLRLTVHHFQGSTGLTWKLAWRFWVKMKSIYIYTKSGVTRSHAALLPWHRTLQRNPLRSDWKDNNGDYYQHFQG